VRVTETSGLQWCGRVLRWDDEGWLGEYVALGAGRPGGEVGPWKHGGRLWAGHGRFALDPADGGGDWSELAKCGNGSGDSDAVH